MAGNPVSEMVRDSMSALEYHEAAWEAHELEAEPPDPSDLSDRALSAILRYETCDMPPEAVRAIRAERKRRIRPWGLTDIALGVAVLVGLAASGLIIGWFLLVN